MMEIFSSAVEMLDLRILIHKSKLHFLNIIFSLLNTVLAKTFIKVFMF